MYAHFTQVTNDVCTLYESQFYSVRYTTSHTHTYPYNSPLPIKRLRHRAEFQYIPIYTMYTYMIHGLMVNVDEMLKKKIGKGKYSTVFFLANTKNIWPPDI